ncbi:pilus assembly protein PilM [Bacteriovoracaceae bacterium]|nr:pilus assembly protein PilM [Bacteriovoracaceae bacterium]
MKILAINIGTYSIKFLEMSRERKTTEVLSAVEVPLSQSTFDYETSRTYEIINNYILKNKFDGKIILSLLSSSLTTRFISFPTAQRRKIDAMIPYQLDKDLPISSDNIQYSSQIITDKDSSYVICSIMELETFDVFFNKLKKIDFSPHIISSEINCLQSFALQKHLDGPICILDIGHETTKAYFIYHRRIVANHISIIAGKVVNESLQIHYEISPDEAIQYKHEKAFFLTPKQMESVMPEQREFAKLMDRIFSPLISDIQRWCLGFKISYGVDISKLLLTGGGSRLKNIDNYLAHSLSVKTSNLELLQDLGESNDLFDEEGKKANISMAYVMAHSFLSKNRPADFRKGQYAMFGHSSLPLHSCIYITTRITVCCILLCIFFGFEYFILSKQNVDINKKITKILKTKELEVSGKMRRNLKKRPLVIYKKIKENNKQILKEIDFLNQIDKIDAMSPLTILSINMQRQQDWNLNSYVSQSDLIEAKFSYNTSKGKDTLIKQLDKIKTLQNIYHLMIDDNQKKKELIVKIKDIKK